MQPPTPQPLNSHHRAQPEEQHKDRQTDIILKMLQQLSPSPEPSQLISQGSGRSPSATLINEAEEPGLQEPYGGIL